MYRVLRLPVLGIYGNFTRSSVSPISVVLVSLLAAVDAAAEGVLAQIVPLQGRRGFATLPLFLDHDVIGCFVSLTDLLVVAQRVGVPRGSRRSLRWLLLRYLFLTHERNVPIDHIVLHVRWPVVVGLC